MSYSIQDVQGYTQGPAARLYLLALLERMMRHTWSQVKKPVKATEPEDAQADNPLDTIFVSSEVAPWSKTGGLGDVVGSLPIALAKRGHRVMVVAPR